MKILISEKAKKIEDADKKYYDMLFELNKSPLRNISNYFRLRRYYHSELQRILEED